MISAIQLIQDLLPADFVHRSTSVKKKFSAFIFVVLFFALQQIKLEVPVFKFAETVLCSRSFNKVVPNSCLAK